MQFWLDSCQDRFSRIAQAFGAPPKPEEAVSCVVALNKSLKLPGLAEMGVKQMDFPGLASLAESNVSNSSNPVPMTASDYQGILEQAMTGQLSQT
jgi:alcohol dehydrogenase class IV